MSGSSESQRKEIEALWSEVFGEAPACRADPRMLADVLIRHLPPAPPYGDPLIWRDREPLPVSEAPILINAASQPEQGAG